MGVGGAVQEITRIWQVEAPKYPRNKFCRLGRGRGWGVSQSPRYWSPEVGIRDAPR